MEYLRDDRNFTGLEEAPKEISEKATADAESDKEITSFDSAKVKVDTPEVWGDYQRKIGEAETHTSMLVWLKFTGRKFLAVNEMNLNCFIFREEGFATPCSAFCGTIQCHCSHDLL